MTSPALGYQTRGPAAVIALPKRAEAGTVLALRSRSERALNAGHRWIAVDLRAVDHIDTPTLAELCVALRQISAHGHRLRSLALISASSGCSRSAPSTGSSFTQRSRAPWTKPAPLRAGTPAVSYSRAHVPA